MAKYTLCPRCELNYILEGQDYCDVCKAQLKLGPQMMFSPFGDDFESDKILCPVCKTNYISEEEHMCQECRENLEYKQREDDLGDSSSDDESWRQYLDEDEKEEISKKGDEDMVSFSQIEEEEADVDEYDEEIDAYTNEPTSKSKYDDFDDFDIPPVDDDDFLDDDEEDEDDDAGDEDF